MLEKLQRAHPTLRGHFAPIYLVGSNMLRAYLFFIYDNYTEKKKQHLAANFEFVNIRDRFSHQIFVY